jgi:hypothetical protein
VYISQNNRLPIYVCQKKKDYLYMIKWWFGSWRVEINPNLCISEVGMALDWCMKWVIVQESRNPRSTFQMQYGLHWEVSFLLVVLTDPVGRATTTLIIESPSKFQFSYPYLLFVVIWNFTNKYLFMYVICWSRSSVNLLLRWLYLLDTIQYIIFSMNLNS